MYWPKFKQSFFPGQQEGEEIYLLVREHWMVFFLRFLSWLIFAAILLFSDWAIGKYAPALQNAPCVTYVNLVKSVYLMFLMLGLLIMWVIYYLNVQIITNQRVVDITQNSLLHHTVSELHLSRIEDVTAETMGVFGTLLDYGNVYVQTAGETERFVFSCVPNPNRVEKLILDLYEALPPEQKQKGLLDK
jgi:hypothetical protein